MGTGAPLKTPTNHTDTNQLMTADLAAALLNRAGNGAELLQVLDSIADDVAESNIADCAAHYAASSAPTADPIQF